MAKSSAHILLNYVWMVKRRVLTTEKWQFIWSELHHPRIVIRTINWERLRHFRLVASWRTEKFSEFSRNFPFLSEKLGWIEKGNNEAKLHCIPTSIKFSWRLYIHTFFSSRSSLQFRKRYWHQASQEPRLAGISSCRSAPISAPSLGGVGGSSSSDGPHSILGISNAGMRSSSARIVFFISRLTYEEQTRCSISSLRLT